LEEVYTEMKRKVNAGKLRLSPNEEALILKEDYERRRKLRLLQVREQEKDIALQIREDVKQRRNQHFARLAEELRTEWKVSQTQKIRNLEKLYLASLRNMGEGHRQAKENEPDLDALARRAAERKRKADIRHQEALKVQKNQKEILTKQKTWHIKARKEALLVEKKRSAKITSRPPPPPTLFENIEVKRISSMKTSSSTYHHISTLVNREMVTKQPDAHLAAEEEAKRLEELQKQAAQERMEQFEKAHVRGFQAMKKIHLAQNQEKLMKELKQLQQEDLARRRQTVAQMPPQLVELPYKRNEMKEDWQRELEFAFEDMYNADRKVKGNLILHLEPEPLPAVTDQIQDEELDLSMEQDNAVTLAMKTQQVPSRILFKKLLNRIRSQKSLWTIKSMSEDESEMITTVSEIESRAPTIESGTVASEERKSSEQEQVVGSDILTIESGPLSSEDKSFSCQTDARKEEETSAVPSVTTLAQSSVLLHPQEEAVRVRMSARQKQIMEIEEQKQKQLELLEQIEQQKLRLETDCFRAQLEEEKRKKAQHSGVGTASAPCTVVADDNSHRQMIHNYQQQLLQQNRLHRQSVETARKQLLEYQTILKRRYPSTSASSLISDPIISVPPWKSEKPTAVSEHWDQSQSHNKYQPMKSIQFSKLEQDHIQVLKQNHFPQGQVKTTEILSTSDVLAKQSLESQKYLRQSSQSETQQSDYELIPKVSHILSRALSHDRPVELQDTRKISKTSMATTSQTLDSQQILSENSKNLSSRLTETSLFLPEGSFSIPPVKVESGKVQETVNRSSVSVSHSVISQMHDRPLSSPETITAQQDNLKSLQKQLELQKEVLQARQEAQEQLLLSKQKELEEQIGRPVFLPMVTPDVFTSLPSAKAESGKIQEASPTKNTTTLSSSDPVISGLQDRLLSFSQPILPQQNNSKLLQEQLNVQRDNLQARREAQEVLFIPKQSELDGKISYAQAEPSSLPHQVTEHTRSSLPFADRKSGKIQEQQFSKSEKGLLSNQSEIPESQDGVSSFLQQFRPLHDSLKLLQEQLTTQRDTLQARHDAQMDLLFHRQRDLGDDKSGQVSSSYSTVVAQHSDDLQVSAKAEPRRVQKLYLSEEENITPPSDLMIPALQDKSLSFPYHILPRQENLTTLQEQSHIQRVVLDAGQVVQTQEFVPEQNELKRKISSEQTGISLPVSQVAESERSQEFMSIKSDSTVPLSHSKIPRFQEGFLRISKHILPLQDNLEEHQDWLDTERKDFHFSQKTQENTSSDQTGLSSFIPQLRQLSFTSFASADSVTMPEPLSTDSDSKVPSRHLQIPELQDRLLKISQRIQPQQDNLKAIQEQLATQREAFIQSRQEAQKEMLLDKQSRWKGRMSPEQAGTSSSLLLSLSPTESERTQELCPTISDSIISSSHSEMQKLPDRLWGLSPPVLTQQDNSIVLQEQLNAQTISFPSIEKTQKEFVLPQQCKFEEKVSLKDFIQPHHGDMKVLQQQLDTQRKVIRSGQEVQEELLLQRLSKLEKRVSSEQISSSSFLSQETLPAANSERMQKSSATKIGDTETVRSQDRLLSFSQPILLQQNNLTAQFYLERSMVNSNEKPREELLLNKQSQLNKSEYAEHDLSSLFQSKELEHSFIPLPFAEAKSESICELYSPKNGHAAPSSDSTIPRFQSRLSQPVLAQQDKMDLQKQMDLQKEVLQYRQKAQEELLLQRQTALQQQIQKHQETLKDFFKGRQASKLSVENVLKTQEMEQLREWLPHIQDLTRNDQQSIRDADKSEHLDKEPGRRTSKPPVARVKSGLDLNQHELSAIQEVESPPSGRTSIPGNQNFYQDRDPMRVSISREQIFFGSPVARVPVGCLQPAVQESVCSSDGDETVKVKESDVENHAILSYTDKRIFHEPLSSVTLSTGSFISYENTDLSLTDPVDLDFPELEHIFPNLHHQLFKPLEPHPDFDLSSLSSGISQDDRNFYQTSDLSSERHSATAPKSTVSFTALRKASLHPFFNTSLNQPPDLNLAQAAAQRSEESFQQLLPEFSSQEGSQHADLPTIFSIEARDTSQGMENQNYPSKEQTEILQNKKKSVHFQVSRGNLNSTYSSSDEANVFHQLQVQHSTPCSSSSSECLIKHEQESRRERWDFEELSKKDVLTVLPSQGLTEDENETCGVLATDPHVEIDSQLCVRTAEMGTSVQTPHSLSIQNEKHFENSTKTETPQVINLSQIAQSVSLKSSGSFSLQSSIPIWETESGHGIMEEPDLTLVSISDISIIEAEFANLSLEEKNEGKGLNFLHVLCSTTSRPSDPHTLGSVNPNWTLLSLLQEAFVKRKKSFLERSYQRQKEIRNKSKLTENSQIRTVKEKQLTCTDSWQNNGVLILVF
uniref:Centrosomal protein 295 n=1 Tax=Spermophilus dauricus TaxID=99837 RepID=A0A8C9PL63_SPEDA